ncbi:hypothetical protein ACJW30_09G021300 [Castanea mollissima]
MLPPESNLGCTITSVPDKDGKLADVVLGFNSLEPYLKYYVEVILKVFNLELHYGEFILQQLSDDWWYLVIWSPVV